jgi:quercetin dioxygenase-like cupin family protein
VESTTDTVVSVLVSVTEERFSVVLFVVEQAEISHNKRKTEMKLGLIVCVPKITLTLDGLKVDNIQNHAKIKKALQLESL